MKTLLFVLLLCIAAVSLVHCINGKADVAGLKAPGQLHGYGCKFCDSQWQCEGVWAGECKNQDTPGECCMKKSNEKKGDCHRRMFEGYPCTPNPHKTWTPGGMMCPCDEYTVCHKGICKYPSDVPKSEK